MRNKHLEQGLKFFDILIKSKNSFEKAIETCENERLENNRDGIFAQYNSKIDTVTSQSKEAKSYLDKLNKILN